MELMTGEAGVLRTALGVVLAREGIDVRVRVYLWSGGVEDVVLPTMNAEPFPVGAQVIVQFLSDQHGERDGAGDDRGAALVAACRGACLCGAHAAAAAGDGRQVCGAGRDGNE